ncbi:hypothetical protein ACQP00_13060 [Dactylosporangium sp. CS-047395]|uniref:hypothetical protein n=1 Tax=Dactylosporangium sp. CS-047395 TaxID=3239936 RepID=UPI003D93A6A9
MTMTFGIYAGGLGADVDGSVIPGPPEDPGPTAELLDELGVRVVRGYLQYSDAEGGHIEAPPRPWQHAVNGRKLDLVVCFREPGADLTGWIDFLRTMLRTHGDCLATLQVAEEANHDGPGGDAGFPAVRRAIVEGVLAARAEADRLGLDVGIGCNSTPIFDPAQEFWTSLKEIGPVIDYAGLDFFPDVFRPLADIRGGVEGVLRGFREQSLAAAGVPATTPIHITEHGWGTGPGRSLERQAEVVEEVVRTVASLAGSLNIAAYEHFALRDGNSTVPRPMSQFGLVRSDYTPKPAFDVFRRLIAELS